MLQPESTAPLFVFITIFISLSFSLSVRPTLSVSFNSKNYAAKFLNAVSWVVLGGTTH